MFSLLVQTIKIASIFMAGVFLVYGAKKNKIPGAPPVKRLLLLTEQAENRILMVDADAKEIVWEWRASDVRDSDKKWFGAPSDVKSVYDGKYILMNASGGGVALVRMADKKTVFYGYAGGNTHSAELFPDGNIVTASSTGNYLAVFHTDTLHFPDNVYSKKIFLPFAHNVVWDQKRNLLWAAGKNKLYRYKYNFNCSKPDLSLIDSTTISETDAHDLFPVYGKDELWLTTPKALFRIDAHTNKLVVVAGEHTANIKSITSGPAGFPTIIMLPQEKWWSNEVLDTDSNVVFKQEGLKIYKSRWMLPSLFSYPAHHTITYCTAKE